MAKIADINEKIAKTVTEGYKKIEEGVVDGFGKLSDKCIDTLFIKEGESLEEARARLSGQEKK